MIAVDGRIPVQECLFSVEPVFTAGDIFSAPTHAIGLGLSANGRLDVSPLHTTLQDRFPVFASDYRRRGRAGLLTAGRVWVWRDSQPWVVALIVRETPPGAARLRYVEACLLYLYHNWQREGLRDLALARFIEGPDWEPVRDLLLTLGRLFPGPLTVYDPVDRSDTSTS